MLFVKRRRGLRGVADLHTRRYRYQSFGSEKGGFLRETCSGESPGYCQMLRDSQKSRQAAVLRVQSAIRSELLKCARPGSQRRGRTRSYN